MALRKQINEALAAAGGAKLSVNDFIVKASALVRPPPHCVLQHHVQGCKQALAELPHSISCRRQLL